MKYKFIAMAAICGMGMASVATSCNGEKKEHQNPFMTAYDTPYEIPPFESITVEDYLPALRAGIEQHNAAIDSIVNNPEAPTFENTILALEKSSELLDKVNLVFFALGESDGDEAFTKMAEEYEPLLTAHSDEVSMNAGLFERVKTLYDNLDSLNLDTPRRRAVESRYKSFTRNGALLSEADKEKLKAINSELTGLYQQFNKNLLNATNEFKNPG